MDNVTLTPPLFRRLIAAFFLLLYGTCSVSCQPRYAQTESQGVAIAKYAQYLERKYPAVPQGSVVALFAAPEEGKTILLDARSAAEQAVSRIPGAIDWRRFDPEKERYREQEIVVYCTIGERSSAYVSKLLALGFQAKNLRGGLLAWIENNGPLVDPEGAPTKRVHVYSRRWKAVPADYEALW